MTYEPDRNPYYVGEHPVSDYRSSSYFYCHSCNTLHFESEGYKTYYSCDISDVYMTASSTCNREFAQKRVDGHNRQHHRLAQLSMDQGYEPITI